MVEVNVKERKIKNKTILKDIDFKIGKGEIVGFVGENGAGKSSIMKIITGLTSNYNGYVKYNGKEIINNKLFSAFIEEPKYIDTLTGKENIKYFSKLSSETLDPVLMELIKRWDMKKHLNKKVKNYSLGTKQKLGLIITFLLERDYLIIDEPTNGMDDDSRRAFFQYIKYLQEKGKSVLLSSHNLNEISEVCNRIVKVKNGSIEDDDYDFSKVVTIRIGDIDKVDLESKFNIINIDKNNVKVEYDKDFIKNLAKLHEEYEDVQLISINNYYREKI